MLSTEQLLVIEHRVANEKKSTGLAYVLWFFFGPLGIQNFYIGRSGLGLVELLFGFGGWVLLGVGFASHSREALSFSILLLGLWIILWLFDLFTIPRGVRKYQEKLRAKYIREFSAVYGLRHEPPLAR